MELRLLKAWIVSGPDKVPRRSWDSQPASVTNPDDWGTFEQACSAGYKHIGFVFSKLWPYAGVDLDKPLTPEQEERHAKICEVFQTYQELSQSGNGVHIICKGNVPSGVRKDQVEVYSDGRYFIFSGNVLNESPITDCQELLTKLWEEMAPEAPAADLVEQTATISDEQLLQMAQQASNADKFVALWRGNTNGYPSQSEADFALLAMLLFYSKSNEQVRRIFRQSSLGTREKAVKNDDYLDRAIGKIRGRQEATALPAIDLSGLMAKYTESPVIIMPQPSVVAVSAPFIVIEEPAPLLVIPSATLPPGLIGEMADYIYSSAIRPIPEVGLSMALAMGAGFLGRQFNISSTGFNQYIILVGQTGVGKEGGVDGVETLLSAIRAQIPQVDEFVGPASFASGQAFVRHLDKSNNFFSIFGEIGITLRQICDKKANSSEVQFKKVLLDLYGKSGHNKWLRPSVYSDKEKNTGLVKAPCVSFWGDTTPEIFYSSMDSEHLAQGVIPRMLVMNYEGKRPPQNPNAFHPPSERLTQQLVAAFQTMLAMKYNDQFCQVPLDVAGKKIMAEFNQYADDKINDNEEDAIRQLWTRAYLKALKLAGLIAVGCNLHQPVVTKEIAAWALALVSRDVENMAEKFASGEVGQGDHQCEADIKKAVDKYPLLTAKQRAAYNVPEKLREMPSCIPYVYLKQYCKMRTAFKNHPRGAVIALDIALKDMLKSGILQPVPALEVKSRTGTDSPLYYRGEAWKVN